MHSHNKYVLLIAGVGATVLVAGVVRHGPASRPILPTASEKAAVAAASEMRSPADARFADTLFEPLPLDSGFDPAKVALGDRLFHEVRLSGDGTTSCASCHDLANGGADSRRFSTGVGGRPGSLNAPTVFNSGYNFRQFWDGRASTLEQQVDGPLLHLDEMAASWTEVLPMLEADASYASDFEAIYEDGVAADNVRDSLAVFQRSLITPNARFDRYLRDETAALTPEETAGYRLFTDIGCATCHQGINIGGSMFQKLGRRGNYFDDRGGLRPGDFGRFNVTGDERDKFKFKVPSLRNVELTAPYMHDGSASTLEDAVQVMARYQIGTELREGELDALVAFLRTLTGQSPRRE